MSDRQAHRAGARAHGGARHGAAGPRRGDRPGGRSRSSARRASSSACSRRSSSGCRRCASSSSTSPRAPRSTSSAVRAPGWRRPSRRSICCMNRNALFNGGLRPHHYCAAAAQERERARGAAHGRHPRQPAVLSRHRQRPTRASPEGGSVRLRRSFLRARRHRAVCRGLRERRRARQARGVRFSCTARISTGCRATPRASPWCASPGRCRRAIRSARMSWYRCAPASAWRGGSRRPGRHTMNETHPGAVQPAPTAALMSRRFRGYPARGHRCGDAADSTPPPMRCWRSPRSSSTWTATAPQARRHPRLSRAALRRCAPRSGVVVDHRHRPTSSAAPRASRTRRAAADVPRGAPRGARATAAGARSWWATMPPSTWDSSTPRWRAPTSSATPFTPSPASIPRRSPGPASGRRCSPRRSRWRGSRGTRARRIQRAL